MSQNYLIYRVSQANMAGTMAVTQVAAGQLANGFPTAPTAMTVVNSDNEPMLLVYDSSSDTAQGYLLEAGSVQPVPAGSFKIGTRWDIVEGYVSGTTPCLMCYRASDGTFALFKLTLPLSSPVTFSLSANPGMTKGLTTAKPFMTRQGVAFLGYNQATGSVAIYSAGANPGAPKCVWSHQWARGWTRFAFFQFGTANFFFKTNVAKLNVNIDHVIDGLTSGTVQIGSQLSLDDALELTSVQPLTMANGDPHFVTYQPSGTSTLNRFDGNCLGWTTLATWNSVANGTHVVPFLIGEDAYVLFS